MWCTLEVHEAMLANIPVRGLFDMYRWSLDKFQAQLAIETAKGECSPSDKPRLTAKINQKGGFERLDESIQSFRGQMQDELKELLEDKRDVDSRPGPSGGGQTSNSSWNVQQKYDWKLTEDQRVFNGIALRLLLLHHQSDIFVWCTCRQLWIRPSPSLLEQVGDLAVRSCLGGTISDGRCKLPIRAPNFSGGHLGRSFSGQ